MFDKLKAYKVYSNDAIFFKFILDESDLASSLDSNESLTAAAAAAAASKIDENQDGGGGCESDSKQSMVTLNGEFQPEFTHQIFGDEETIFGYKNLKINYYLTPGLLDAYIGFTYSDKVSPRKFDGLEPDDIYSQFVEFGCSPGFTRNLNSFRAEKLSQDRLFRPFGDKIHEFHKNLSQGYHKFKDITNGKGNGEDTNTMSTFEIYRVDASSPDFETQKFRDYLIRVQTMLVFYIETSNFIDEEDTKWTHYLLYERRKTSNGEFRYLTMGYVSVYNFYAYPDKTRMRVSQMMILPPYQRFGHGAELLEAVYRDAAANPDVVDVTAEAPSPEFIALRDFVIAKLCSSLATFRDVAKLRVGFSSDMAAEALKNFKLPKLQSRRAYEIIRMANTSEHDERLWTEFSAYVKKRLYATFLKFSKFARQSKMLSGDQNESNASSDNADNQDDGPSTSGEKVDFNKLLVCESERNQYINQQFEEAIKEYRKVAQRLEACRIIPF